MIAFWYPKSIDREDGGYLIDFDAHGAFKGEGPKMIVTQARMLWLSSRLIREGRGGDQMREAARQGYRFLMDHMWDQEHGGFYWEVDRAGRRVVAPHKHLYGQAFGLYALSEYARATGDAQALADARRLFDLHGVEGARRDVWRLRGVLRVGLGAGAPGRPAVPGRPDGREDDEHAPPSDGSRWRRSIARVICRWPRRGWRSW